jgi:ABC-2 type transport system ATP-binding protein
VIFARGTVRVSDSLEALCRMPDPSVTVQVTGDCQKLLGRLEQKGLRAKIVLPQQLQIIGDAESLSPTLWVAASESDCVIRSVTPSKNSLEQIFLDAVREVHRADS